MVMRVRNFWASIDIEGQETSRTGGPLAKDGGMSGKVQQRNRGKITNAFEFWSRLWHHDGEDALLTTVTLGADAEVRLPHGTVLRWGSAQLTSFVLPAGTELTVETER